jgi:hypothetical protein
MKKHPSLWITAALLAMVMFSFNSCDKLEEADDISFDADFTVTFNASESVTDTDKHYFDRKVLDATSNSKVKDYAAKIKKIKINKITYLITNYSAPGAVLFSGGTLGFSSVTSLTPSVVADNVAENLMTTTSETELDMDTDQLNEIANDLLQTLSVGVYTDGTLSSTPVAFSVPVKFYVTITANAL